MNAPEFYIPIEKDISRFAQHLRTHHRTILSAGFGDGKSFFLDRFKDDEQIKDEFKLIKLYPINYQVVENTDVFTLLKYDILLQLLVEGMVSETPIEGVQYLHKDAAAFLTALFEGFAQVDPSPKAQIPEISFKALNSLFDIHEKRKIMHGGDRSARALLKRFEKNPSLYNQDVVTKIIHQSLSEWKEKTKQKTVLVIEDMDRIDPANLFRLLNVFSAHMDYIYRNGEPPTESLVGSRFGFDSIVFVLEYENLKRLFAHFYGDGASFGGYINKFMPQGYFEYSLRKSANSYLYETLSRITGLNQVHISGLLDPIMNTISIRDMAYAVKDLESQVTLDYSPEQNVGFLLMIVAMKRLGMKPLQIINSCEEQFKKDTIHFVRYFMDFMSMEGFSDKQGFIKVGNTTMYFIAGRNKDGFADLGQQTPVPNDIRIFNMHTFVSKLFEYIIP